MIPDFDLDAFVAATLAEDLGTGGDITSNAVIPAAPDSASGHPRDFWEEIRLRDRKKLMEQAGPAYQIAEDEYDRLLAES